MTSPPGSVKETKISLPCRQPLALPDDARGAERKITIRRFHDGLAFIAEYMGEKGAGFAIDVALEWGVQVSEHLPAKRIRTTA